MKSIYMKLLKYLKNTSEKLSSDTVYLRTDCRKDVYTSLTLKERNDMSNDHNWIHDIIPRAQVDAMNKAGQLQQQKKTTDINALAKAGDVKNKQRQMGMDLVRQAAQNKNQQKEKPTK